MSLRLYNTLTRLKDVFAPIDPAHVRMYVCGPTVYDQAHIGNARPIIVFDVLYRLLRHLYGDAHVKYVRNITDVDDKINARAAERGISIRELTEATAEVFQEDVAALGCLPPDVEPRATDHIAEMVEIVEKLIAGGHAYVADGHVLFSVPSMAGYGRLSRRPLDEMIAGARVDVAPYKRGDMDFVLWKPSSDAEPGWDSPWGRGRPGWHIECSAMSWKHLGEMFDIHGGGIDLVFPHHENEIAQSRCAFGRDVMANVWMHNGFLQVEGRKMSKSSGNFVTINDLLHTEKFGGRRWPGEVLRLAMLKTHYRQPIDWTVVRSNEAEHKLLDWYHFIPKIELPLGVPDSQFLAALQDDLNLSNALKRLDEMVVIGRSMPIITSNREQLQFRSNFKVSANLIGLLSSSFEDFQAGIIARQTAYDLSWDVSLKDHIEARVAARLAARAAKNWAESDRVRDELLAHGIVLKDNKDGTTTWEHKR